MTCKKCGVGFETDWRKGPQKNPPEFCSRHCSNARQIVLSEETKLRIAQKVQANWQKLDLAEQEARVERSRKNREYDNVTGLKNNAAKLKLEARYRIEAFLASGGQGIPKQFGIGAITFRRYVLDVLKEQCSKCNQDTTWQGEPLNLQVDHIDGNAANNVLTNLRVLCPNCHSQTPTFGAKNYGKSQR